MAFIWPTKMAARVGATAAGSARPLWRSSVQVWWWWCVQEPVILYNSEALNTPYLLRGSSEPDPGSKSSPSLFC